MSFEMVTKSSSNLILFGQNETIEWSDHNHQSLNAFDRFNRYKRFSHSLFDTCEELLEAKMVM